MVLGVFLYIVVIAALAAAATFALARRRLLLDQPNERSSHVTPVPRAGGIAIVGAAIAGSLALWLGGHPQVLAEPAFAVVLLGGLVAAAGGLADDVRARGFAFKLGIQIAAALVVIAKGLVIETLSIPGIGPVALGVFAPALTAVWLVGLTNAYNFMDGIDGLAGGTAVIGFGALMFAALGFGQVDEAAIACTFAAAALGFLLFNLPPAKIFMGDVGSQFLGFGFAALGVLIARQDASGTLFLLVPLVLFHFLFDTIFTAIRRWRRGETITQAHRSHLYQRLTHAGFGHGRTTALLCLIGLAQGIGALWLVQLPPSERWWPFVPALLVQLVYWQVVVRREERA